MGFGSIVIHINVCLSRVNTDIIFIMGYLPSKKFFLVLFSLILLFLGIFFVVKITNEPTEKTGNNTGVKIIPAKGATPIRYIPMAENVSTSTLLARAMYLDEMIKASATSTVVQDVVDSTAQEMQAIKDDILSDPYSSSDVKISKDNSAEAIRRYGNNMGRNILVYGGEHQESSEIDIMKRAYVDKDTAALKELDPFISFYKNLVKSSLSLSVPSDAVALHVRMLNAYSSEEKALEGIRSGINPDNEIRFTASFVSYGYSTKKIAYAFGKANEFFTGKGIIFTPADPGAAFANLFAFDPKK